MLFFFLPNDTLLSILAKEVVPSFDPWAPEGFNARRQREKALDTLDYWMFCVFFLGFGDLVICK